MFSRRVLIASLVPMILILVFLLIWYALHIFLYIFLGLLVAVFLRGLGDGVRRVTSLPKNWSVLVSLAAVFALLVGAVWLLVPNLAAQADQLSVQLPLALGDLREKVEQYRLGRQLVKTLPSPSDLVSSLSALLPKMTGFLSSTLGLLAGAVIVLFVGIYFSFQAELYIGGAIRLLPKERRARGLEILNEVRITLRWWLVGRIFSMAVIGILTALGLWLLGIPLALTLGVLAALLTFVPYVGPVLSAVPAVLLGLAQSPHRALWVVILYLALQIVESYVLTPLVQKKAVSLPPAYTISFQAVFTVLAGALGLVVATPIAAVTLVLVRMIYIEDFLEE